MRRGEEHAGYICSVATWLCLCSHRMLPDRPPTWAQSQWADHVITGLGGGVLYWTVLQHCPLVVIFLAWNHDFNGIWQVGQSCVCNMPGYVNGLKFFSSLKECSASTEGFLCTSSCRASLGSVIKARQVVCLFSCGRLSVGLATGYI